MQPAQTAVQEHSAAKTEQTIFIAAPMKQTTLLVPCRHAAAMELPTKIFLTVATTVVEEFFVVLMEPITSTVA
jgi:hypothetical protein